MKVLASLTFAAVLAATLAQTVAAAPVVKLERAPSVALTPHPFPQPLPRPLPLPRPWPWPNPCLSCPPVFDLGPQVNPVLR